MQDMDQVKERSALNRTKRICRIINKILKVVFVFVCAYWAIGSALMFFAVLNPDTVMAGGDKNDYIIDVLLNLLTGIIVNIQIFIFLKIFSSAAKGESPFSMKQVPRLRIISALMVVFSILDSLPLKLPVFAQVGVVIAGVVAAPNNPTIVSFNFAPLVSAGIIFAFSFVFKYGVLLQRLSDGTL